jgi:hypothetical protein
VDEKKPATEPTTIAINTLVTRYVLPESELEKGFDLSHELQEASEKFIQRCYQELESQLAVAAAQGRTVVGTVPRLVEVPGHDGQPPQHGRRVAGFSWLIHFDGDVT